MGREIRRVPLNWKHPEKDFIYKPLHYENYRQRKWKEGEAVAYQLYENVSEGTPLSPVFEKPKDLMSYLTSKGDFWGNVWSKEAVEFILKNGSCPSLILKNGETFKPHEQSESKREN